MNEQGLKALENLGAELGAAKAENERLRGLLRELRDVTSEYAWDADLEARVDAALSQQAEQQHPDDAAVDRFAAAMKAKLAAARAKGRGGWDDPNVCSVEFLAQLLVEHLGKGNTGTFEDVANFAMMLHQRGAEPRVLADAARPAQTEQQPEQSGLVLMPKEATPEIVAAMKSELDKSPAWYCRYKAAYRAALSAQGAGDADS